MADQTHRMDDGHAPGSDTPAPARRSSGSRGADVRDAVAEMTVRAHEISQDAGAKMSTALRDVINAAAGLAGFAVESARDLVQFMVRRGQMSASEAELLLRDAEAAHARQLKANPPKAQPSTTAAGGSTRGGAAEKAPAKAPPAKAGAKAAPAKAPAKAATKAATKAPAKKATKAAAPARGGTAKSSARAVTKAAKPVRGTSAKAGAKTATARKPATKATAKTPARKPVKRK